MARSLSDAALNSTYLGVQQDWQDFLHTGESQPVRSLRSGLENMKSSYYDTKGALSRTVGATGVAGRAEEQADIHRARSAGMRGNVPTLETAEGLGDYGRIATDWVFSNAPLMGAMFVASPIGGAIGRGLAGAKALRAGVTAEAENLAAAQAAKQAVWKNTAQAKGRAGAALGAKEAEAAYQAQRAKAGVDAAAASEGVLAKATTQGTLAGAYVPYAMQTIGENYGRVRNDPNAEGSDWAKAATSLGAGAAQAGIGVLAPYHLLKNFGRGMNPVAAAGIATAEEGTTEMVEQVLQRAHHGMYNEDVNLFDEDARREYLESFLAGAVVGGAYAAPVAGGKWYLDRRNRQAGEETEQVGDMQVDTAGAKARGIDPTTAPPPSGESATAGDTDPTVTPDIARAMQEGLSTVPDTELKHMSGVPQRFVEPKELKTDQATDAIQAKVQSLNAIERGDFDELHVFDSPEFAQTVYLEASPEERQQIYADFSNVVAYREALSGHAVGVASGLRGTAEQNDLQDAMRKQGETLPETPQLLPLDQDLADPRRLNLSQVNPITGREDTLSLPVDPLNQRTVFNGKAIPDPHVGDFVMRNIDQLHHPEVKQQLFAIANEANIYRTETLSTNTPSESFVFTLNPRAGESIDKNGRKVSLLYGDEHIPLSRSTAQTVLQDFTQQRIINGKSVRDEELTTAPGGIYRRKSNMTRPQPVLNLINSWLPEGQKIISAEIELDHESDMTGELSSEEQSHLGLNTLSKHFDQLGYQPLASVDNKVFFAPKNKVGEIYSRLGIENDGRYEDGAYHPNQYGDVAPTDVESVQRLGVMLKRPGATEDFIHLVDPNTRQALPFYEDKINSGTVAIHPEVKGMRQITGIAANAEGDPVLVKGMIRGALTFNGQTEEFGMNSEAAFGREINPYEGMTISDVNAITPSSARESLQALGASARNAPEVIRNDTAEQFSTSTVYDRLSAEDKAKVDQDIPVGLLAGDMSFEREIKQFRIIGGRAKAMSSTLVPRAVDAMRALEEYVGKPLDHTVRREIDHKYGTDLVSGKAIPAVLLLPGTAAKLHTQLEAQGLALQVGQLLLVKREPALPNASSMRAFIYMGETSWADGSTHQTEGVVVNSTDSDAANSIQSMGLDFDGDDLVAMDIRKSKVEIRQFHGDPEAAKSLVATGKTALSSIEGVNPKGAGRLTQALLKTQTGFSQSIGNFIAMAEKLRQAGVLDLSAGSDETLHFVREIRENIAQLEQQQPTAQTEGEIQKLKDMLGTLVDPQALSHDERVHQLEELIAVVAQSSISNKKKTVYIDKIKKLIAEIKEEVAAARQARFRVPIEVLDDLSKFTDAYRAAFKQYKEAYADLATLTKEKAKPEEIREAVAAFHEAARAIYRQNAQAEGNKGNGRVIPASAIRQNTTEALPAVGKRFTLRSLDGKTARYTNLEVTSVEATGAKTPEGINTAYKLKAKALSSKAKNPQALELLYNPYTGQAAMVDKAAKSFRLEFRNTLLTELNSLGTLPFIVEALNAMKHVGSKAYKQHLASRGITKKPSIEEEKAWQQQNLVKLAQEILKAPMSEMEAALAERIIEVYGQDAQVGFYQGEEFRMPQHLKAIAEAQLEVEQNYASDRSTEPSELTGDSQIAALAYTKAEQQRERASKAASYIRYLQQLTRLYNSYGYKLYKHRSFTTLSEEEKRHLGDERRTLKNAITALYKLQLVSPAAMIAHGPAKIAANLVSAAQIKAMKDNIARTFSKEELSERGIALDGLRTFDLHVVDNPASASELGFAIDGQAVGLPHNLLPEGVYEIPKPSRNKFMVDEFDNKVPLAGKFKDKEGKEHTIQFNLLLTSKANRLRQFLHAVTVPVDTSKPKFREYANVRIQIRHFGDGTSLTPENKASRNYFISLVPVETETTAHVSGLSSPENTRRLLKRPAFVQTLTPKDQQTVVTNRLDSIPDAKERRRIERDILFQLVQPWVMKEFGYEAKPEQFRADIKRIFGGNNSAFGIFKDSPVLYLRTPPKNTVFGSRITWEGVDLTPTPYPIYLSDGSVELPLTADLGTVLRKIQAGELSKGSGERATVTQAVTPVERRAIAKLQALVNGLTKQLGIPYVTIMTSHEASRLKANLNYQRNLPSTDGTLKEPFCDPATRRIFIPGLQEKSNPEKEAARLIMAGHELGHIIVSEALTAELYQKTPDALEIVRSYREFVERQGGMFSTTQTDKRGIPVLVGLQPGSTASYFSIRSESLPGFYEGSETLDAEPINTIANEGERARILNEAFSFDEYFSDQVALFLVDKQRTVVDKADGFFKTVAQFIQKLYRAIADLINKKPEASVEEFLHKLMDARMRHTSATVANLSQPKANPEGYTEELEEAETGEETEETEVPGETLTETEQNIQDWHSAISAGDTRPLNENTIRSIQRVLRKNLSVRDRQLLQRAAMYFPRQRQMRSVLRKDLDLITEIRHNPDTASAYLYALTRAGLIQVGPETDSVFEKLDRKMTEGYADALGDLANIDRIEALLLGIKSRPNLRSEEVLDYSNERVDNLQRKVLRGLGKGWQYFLKGYDPVFEYMAQRLEETNNPGLQALGRLLDVRPWDAEGTEASYIDRQRTETSRWLTSLARIYKGTENDARLHQLVFDIGYHASVYEEAKAEWATLASGGRPRNPELAKAFEFYNKNQDFFGLAAKYERAGGIEISTELEGRYLPRVWDKTSVQDKPEELIRYVQRYAFKNNWKALLSEEMAKATRRGDTETYANYSLDSTFDDEASVGITARDNDTRMPKNWVHFARESIENMGKEGVQNFNSTKARNPKFDFDTRRKYDFLFTDSKQDQDFLKQYLVQNPVQLSQKYIAAAVKRVEFERVFGKDGTKIVELLDVARKHGATDVQIQQAIDAVDMMTGMYGGRTKQSINNLVEKLPLPKEWKKSLTDKSSGVTHESVRSTSQWLITYENLRTLTTSVFQNSIDLMGALQSSESLDTFIQSARTTFNLMTKRMPQEQLERLQYWMDTVGTAEHAAQNNALMEMYYNMEMGGLARSINNWFFRINGTELTTRAARTVSTFAGNETLLKLKQEVEAGNEKALRFLNEANIKPEELEFNEHGLIKLLTDEERSKAYDTGDTAALDLDFKRRDALHRFTNRSVVRPGPHNRSQIFNDSNLALVAHLRTFPLAFHHAILKRAFTEGQYHSNWVPLLIIGSSFVAVMLMADWLRDRLKHGTDPAPWKAEWTAMDHIGYAIERAGLYGRDQLLVDILKPAMAGDVPKTVAETLGVTASHVHKISNYGFSDADLPFQDLWRDWGDNYAK